MIRKIEIRHAFLLFIAVTQLEAKSYADAPESFTVNPESIRTRVLNGNLAVEAAAYQVSIGHAQVVNARAALAPSLNLGGVINSITSGPSFLLSSVQALLPFLFPSSWFNLKEENNLYQAQLVSYRLMELNTYATVLATYYTYLSDQQIANIYAQEAKDFRQIASLLEEEEAISGDVPPAQLEQAEAQANLAEGQALKLGEMMDQEKAGLLTELNLPTSSAMTIVPLDAPPSSYELKPASTEAEKITQIENAIADSAKMAPEIQQTEFLVAAAKNAKWSSFFGFLGGATIGQAKNSSGNGLGPLGGSAQVTLGASTFTNLRLSNLNIENIQFQETETKSALQQVLDSNLRSIDDANQQLAKSTLAEKELMEVYEQSLNDYNMGLGSLTDLLLLRTQAASAAVTKVQNQADLNLLRTTVHRALLSDQFKWIGDCQPNYTRNRKVTLDELCHTDPAADSSSD